MSNSPLAASAAATGRFGSTPPRSSRGRASEARAPPRGSAGASPCPEAEQQDVGVVVADTPERPLDAPREGRADARIRLDNQREALASRREMAQRVGEGRRPHRSPVDVGHAGLDGLFDRRRRHAVRGADPQRPNRDARPAQRAVFQTSWPSSRRAVSRIPRAESRLTHRHHDRRLMHRRRMMPALSSSAVSSRNQHDLPVRPPIHHRGVGRSGLGERELAADHGTKRPIGESASRAAWIAPGPRPWRSSGSCPGSPHPAPSSGARRSRPARDCPRLRPGRGERAGQGPCRD